MREQVHITQLVPYCVTRARGEEAAKRLRRHHGTKPIEVDLSGVEMVSLSFLDGFLSYFRHLGKERNIVFNIDSPDVEEKLARIAGIRCSAIYCHFVNQKVQRVEPRLVNLPKAILIPAETYKP